MCFFPKANVFSNYFVLLLLGKQQQFLFIKSLAPKSLNYLPLFLTSNRDSTISRLSLSLKKSETTVPAIVERSLFIPAIFPKKSINCMTVLLWFIWLGASLRYISHLIERFSESFTSNTSLLKIIKSKKL